MTILVNPYWLERNFNYFIKSQHLQDINIKITLSVKDFEVISK